MGRRIDMRTESLERPSAVAIKGLAGVFNQLLDKYQDSQKSGSNDSLPQEKHA